MEIQSFTLTPFQTNCYVLKDGGEALIIDPGEPSPFIVEHVDGCRVAAIVNTHGHCDHCAGNAAVKNETDAQLLCHEADLPLIRGLQQQAAVFGWACDPSPQPDGFLNEGDTLTIGGAQLRVLFAPGHSPGHIALAGDGFVIGGDVLFAGSIGRTDLPGGSHEQLLETIRDRFLTLPDDTVVYPGHGPATTIGEERASNPFLAGL